VRKKDRFFVNTVIHFLLHASPIIIYLIVAVVLMLESSGIPITNNTLLLCTGALASLGHVNIWALMIVAVAGSITGACLAYTIGAHGGRDILLRVARLVRVDVQKVDMIEHWFQKSGIWMVFLSRMTPYVRPFACFPAGITRMNFVQFFVSALCGSIIWCSVLLSIGWSLGRRWGLALHLMQHYTLPVLGVVVLLIALYVFAMYTIKSRLRTQFSSTTDEVRDHAKVGNRRITRKLIEV
jgi:membrane protein DedA with SNARE-associated domain